MAYGQKDLYTVDVVSEMLNLFDKYPELSYVKIRNLLGQKYDMITYKGLADDAINSAWKKITKKGCIYRVGAGKDGYYVYRRNDEIAEAFKNKKKAQEKRGGTIGVVCLVAIFVIIVVIGVSCSSSSSSSSGKKWSELSDVEKDNAKWAYEVQQELNNR